MSPTVATIYHALVAAQHELPTLIGKDNRGRFGQYMTLEHLIEVTRPILSKHAIALHTHILPEEGALYAVTVLTHAESGTFIESRWPLFRDEANPGKLTLDQQYGRSLTYARRYCLLSLLGIGMGDPDPDAQPSQSQAAHATPSPNGAPGPAPPAGQKPNAKQFRQFNERVKAEVHRIGADPVDRILIATQTNQAYEDLSLNNMRQALQQMAAHPTPEEAPLDDDRVPLN